MQASQQLLPHTYMCCCLATASLVGWCQSPCSVCVYLSWCVRAAGLMDYVIADYTWARAVLLLSPTVATLGTSIQVPLATAADVVLGQPHWLDSWQAVRLTAAGTVLILGGVCGINLDPHTTYNSAGAGVLQHLTDPEAASSSSIPLLLEDGDPLQQGS